jgi:hypothetical protein
MVAQISINREHAVLIALQSSVLLVTRMATGSEAAKPAEVVDKVFNNSKLASFTAESIAPEVSSSIPSSLALESPYLTHPVFNMYYTEHELLCYLHKLQSKDLSLCHSMIPLGSCTMMLNATIEMIPVTFPNFVKEYPIVPTDQAAGYHEMFDDLGYLPDTFEVVDQGIKHFFVVIWDLGGIDAIYRLKGKPIFKKGGMSTAVWMVHRKRVWLMMQVGQLKKAKTDRERAKPTSGVFSVPVVAWGRERTNRTYSSSCSSYPPIPYLLLQYYPLL